MTSLLDSPQSVVEALRGDRLRRPLVDHSVAAGLRAVLEDGIYGIVGTALLTTPIVVRAATLARPSGTIDLRSSSPSRLRGVLVHQLLRLHCVGATINDALDDATRAWRAQDPSNDLLAMLDRLDDDERARLSTDVTAHWVTFSRALGDVPSRWMPRTSVRASQSLAGGGVLLRDVVDLMIGTVGDDVASVALFDVTTAPLGVGAERVMRYHALVQTLRTSTKPLRTATFSSATGELLVRDVDDEMLTRSVDEVIACVGDRWIER